MILGRPASLWVSLAASAINVAVFVFGIALSVEQIAILNAFALAVIGLLANQAVTGSFTGRVS